MLLKFKHASINGLPQRNAPVAWRRVVVPEYAKPAIEFFLDKCR
jgi:hypothetical protein